MEGFFCVSSLRGIYLEGLIFGILQYYKFILASSLKERVILYTLFPRIIAKAWADYNSFRFIRRQILEGGDYFKHCSLKV